MQNRLIGSCTPPSVVTLKLSLMLWIGLCASASHAQEIDSDTSAPVATSTIAGGSPADIEITDSGSIELGGTEGQAAVTMDSDSSVTNDGLIQIDDTDNVAGLRVESGRTGDITMSGNIVLQEDYTREDDDDDDDLDGPLALGENRFGIDLDAGGTHTGDIELESGSVLTVEGNDSAAIRLQSALNGDFISDGAIAIVGEDTVGVEADQGVTGDVLIGGSVTAQGTNARGVSLDGDVGGAVTVDGSIVVSGFTSTALTNYVAPSSVTDDTDPLDERIDAEDLNEGGPAFSIGGSVATGLLINGSYDDFISDEDLDDETKDTIEDFDENRSVGAITSYGSGPALLITPDLDGPASSSIVIGSVTETVRDTLDDDDDDDVTETLATFDYEQGLINRGFIAANGLNVGYEASAVQIGGSADGTYSTEIIGGILNAGTISGTAFEADATAVDLQLGAIIDTLENDGAISARVNTVDGHVASALKIADGATLPSFTNTGSITATSAGDSGSAIAIRDLSGTLTDINNLGSISAVIFENGEPETDLGSAIAIDLSGTSQDVTVSQTLETPVDDTNGDDEIDSDDVTAPSILGDVLFGSGNDTFSITSGTVTGDTDFGLGDGDMRLSAVTYTGDINFSSGANMLSVSSSTLTGDISFGGAGGVFDLSSSTFEGRLVSDGGLNALTAVDSDMLLSSDTAARLDTFSISGESLLQVNLDPRVSGEAATLTVIGTADIGEDVLIRPVLETITSTDFTHTFIEADELVFPGTLDDALISDAPFIYKVELAVNQTTTDKLDLQFNLKSADELGLDLNQSAAYAAVLDVFSSDDELGAGLAAIVEEEEFLQAYNLLLPQRTDASTRYLAAQNSAAFGALGNRLNAISNSGDSKMGAWAQEHFTQIEIDPDTDVPGYNGSGLGLAIGMDGKLAAIDVVGIFGTLASGDFEEKTGGTNPVSTSSLGIGVYAMESVGAVDVVASGQVSRIDFRSRRELTLGDGSYELVGEWEGTSAMVSAGASTRLEAGRFYTRPALSVDYFQLDQNAYTETGDDLLAVSVEAAGTDRLSATSVLAFGARFDAGRDTRSYWAPEVTLGYRKELSSTPYETTISYLGSDEVFSILSQETYSDAALAGLSLTVDSELISARLGYDVEIADEGLTHFGGATFRLKF